MEQSVLNSRKRLSNIMYFAGILGLFFGDAAPCPRLGSNLLTSVVHSKSPSVMLARGALS